MAEVNKKRIALVLSGGVSAGAYIAGALDELIAAFNQSNEYEIDIITGGSAGATTGAIVAHGLLFRGGDTSLRKTWVDDVDLFAMLEPENEANSQITVLNGEALVQIAEDALKWAGPDTRAACCAPVLTLAMTLANTTSLPYKSSVDVPTAGDPESFIQYRNAEQQTFEFDSGSIRSDEEWSHIAEVARASSAVPFIFPRVKLERDPFDLLQYRFRPEFSEKTEFWYYDGGTFNNLPIDLANYYIVRKDGENSLGNELRVIMINPWESSSRLKEVPKSAPDLLDFGLRLIEGIRNESSSIDFREPEIAAPPPPVIVVPLPVPIPDVGPPEDPHMAEALPGIDAPDVGLLNRTRMITPANNSKPLRCNYLGHLSAFLDQRFREYDFRRGAADARLLLESMHVPYTSAHPELFYMPDADDEFKNLDFTSYASLKSISLISGKHAGRPLAVTLEETLEERSDYLLERVFEATDLPWKSILAPVARRLIDWKVLKMGDIVQRLW